MNPYPCGYLTHPTRDCTCSTTSITRYQKRISGPLLDRIDIHLEVANANWRASKARACSPTPDMTAREVQQLCRLDEAGEALMRAAMQRLQLSRTIAYLAGSERNSLMRRTVG